MSRTFHHGERHIRVREIRNNPLDLRRLARALIELAQAQAEAEAEAEATARAEGKKRTTRRRPPTSTADARIDSTELCEEKSA